MQHDDGIFILLPSQTYIPPEQVLLVDNAADDLTDNAGNLLFILE